MPLSLETYYTGSINDVERKQYDVDAELQAYERKIRSVQVYPALKELLAFTKVLQTIVRERNSILRNMPRTLEGVDFEEQRLLYKISQGNAEWFENIMNLMERSIVRISRLIIEASKLHDLARRSISISLLGVLPATCANGFWLLQDHEAALFRLYAYKYRVMRSPEDDILDVAVRGIMLPSHVENGAEAVKRRIMERFPESRYSAVFMATVRDEFFPLKGAILPIAKGMLGEVIHLRLTGRRNQQINTRSS